MAVTLWPEVPAVRMMDPIIEECRRIQEDCEYSARSNFMASVANHTLHQRLGVPATALAAAASVSALTEWSSVAAGISALLAALLAGTQSFLSLDQLSAQQHTIGAEYTALRNAARVFERIEFDGATPQERKARVLEMSSRRDDLNRSTPPIKRVWFVRARKAIEEGETQYQVDTGGHDAHTQ